VLIKELVERLPFTLTNSQERVVNEIKEDLRKPVPMMRLLQGDVGSGKTVVAALAMSMAADNKTQSVLMAPTELLAEQHLENLRGWFGPLGVKTVLLKSKLTQKERGLILNEIKHGEVSIIVGTHALFQNKVEYKNLGLVVVDEQHRFGVDQRLSLVKKSGDNNAVPHQLIMTATPIPRTLAMTAYGDLDTSVLDELPKGRGEIKTIVVPDDKRSEVVQKIIQETNKGRQVYWVCPLIEESEELNFEAAETTFKTLSSELPTKKIGLVHGKLKPNIKTKAMVDFKNNIHEILVATTVIEVGVDVPNATIMVIENSERLGLSQLHQLRGRIGRGEHKSLCVLIYKKPLNDIAKQRLNTVRKSVDGFYISEKDLELRGPGELLGTRQKGVIGLKIADISRDAYMLPSINRYCADFDNKYPGLSEKLIDRWVGQQIVYRNV
jgi:ATP-dependent DNA helicase RecG